MTIYFVVNAISIVLIFGVMAGYGYHTHQQMLARGVSTQAKLVASDIAPAILSKDQQTASIALNNFRFSTEIERAQIVLADGRVFAQYSKDNEAKSSMLASKHGWQLFEHNENILDGGQLLGVLKVQASLKTLHITLLMFALITLAISTIALAGAYFLGRGMNFGISKPLEDLTQLIHKIIHTQDFSVRSAISANDEIGVLAGGLNDMLNHIQQRDSALESELTQRKLAEKNLDNLAHYDNVTSLPNRHFFNNYLETAIKETGPDSMLGVIFIDLDNFKIVNDTLGHQAGDVLLKEASQRIRQSLDKNEMFFRIGGDEFAIVLKNMKDIKQAEAAAKEVISLLRQPFDIKNNEIHVGASIGISFYPTQASDLSSLLSNADAAMYHAKSLGKNNFQHYQADMEGRIRRRLNMENSLRRAIDEQELELYYQPQIDIKTLRIVGFEALLRWHHPKMGTINPSEFVPLAEESGLIIPIGDWVMVTACYQAQLWQKIFNADIRMAVNFTARQLKDEGMVEKVLHALAITRLPPHTLDLELTESSLMDNSDYSIEKMKELRRLDIRISIDDFGTGFSSLSYLKRFPLNALKVDRSFIKDIPTNEDDIAITNAIIALANTLKIEVIAEGVESVEQLDYLKQNNCGYAQGNLFCPALPARKMEELLHQLQTPLHLGAADIEGQRIVIE